MNVLELLKNHLISLSTVCDYVMQYPLVWWKPTNNGVMEIQTGFKSRFSYPNFIETLHKQISMR